MNNATANNPVTASEIIPGLELVLERATVYASSGAGVGRRTVRTVRTVKARRSGGLFIRFAGSAVNYVGVVKDGVLVSIWSEKTNHVVMGVA